MKEKWIITELVNTDYPSREYYVSNLGRVKEVDTNNEKIIFDPDKRNITNPRSGHRLHLQRKSIKVRKLVFCSFNNIPLSKRVRIKSLDGNILNVRLDNLCYNIKYDRIQQDRRIDLGCKEARVKFKIGCKDIKIPCDFEYWIKMDFINESFSNRVYFISDMGRIASYNKDTGDYKMEVDTYNQKRKTSNRGYYSWSLNKVSYYIHRLVASYFYHTPITSDLDVHHKNGIKSDNRACNLGWVNPTEHNKIHREHEVLGSKIREYNKKSRKYSWYTVCKIRKMYEEDKMTKNDISKVTGIDHGTIRQIVNYDTYQNE